MVDRASDSSRASKLWLSGHKSASSKTAFVCLRCIADVVVFALFMAPICDISCLDWPLTLRRERIRLRIVNCAKMSPFRIFDPDRIAITWFY